MQQLTLNIIFDGTKIRLDASGIQPQKKNRISKMSIFNTNTIIFSSPAIKVKSQDNHEFDIAFPEGKVCETKNNKNGFINGTTLCQNCYSKALGTLMLKIRRSKRQDFINYQVEQQEDKLQWLKEALDFVLDNEKFLDQNDYSTSGDFRQIINNKQEELNPEPSPEFSPNLNIKELLANIGQQPKSNNKLKTNLTVPQIAYLFKLLFELKPDIFEVDSKAELQRFISANFSTKRTGDQDISTEKLKQLFSDPDPEAAAFWRKHLLTMLDESRKFN